MNLKDNKNLKKLSLYRKMNSFLMISTLILAFLFFCFINVVDYINCRKLYFSYLCVILKKFASIKKFDCNDVKIIFFFLIYYSLE